MTHDFGAKTEEKKSALPCLLDILKSEKRAGS